MQPQMRSIPRLTRRNRCLMALTLSVVILLTSCGNTSTSAQMSATENVLVSPSERLIVSATIFPIYDILQQIAGDSVVVKLILQPGESPHTFNMTPSVQKIVDNSALIFAVGQGLDNWVVDSEIVIPLYTGIPLLTSDHNHDNDRYNPHYWLAPKNGVIIATRIAAELAKVDPPNTEAYRRRAGQFQTEMVLLESDLFQRIKPIQTVPFITLHDSWSYFAEAFQLNLVGVYEPSGAEEPSPKYLRRLEEVVRNSSAKALFTEPQLATTSLKAFTDDHDLKIAMLDPIGGVAERNTYQGILEYNINTLLETLTK